MRIRVLGWAILWTGLWPAVVSGQDSSTASLRVVVTDPSGARVRQASVTLSSGPSRTLATDDRGVAAFAGLAPQEYGLEVEAAGFALYRRRINLMVGSEGELPVILQVRTTGETVTVRASDDPLETSPAGISSVITQQEIEELPLNGRRFADLALTTPQAVQDPRSLTSTSNGDLAFGGIRGFNTSFIVDGTDDNNGFFAQSRGRLRAPYQFGNETIQEFRVSTNTFGVEQGRSAGAVVNVVTKSGTNTHHGSAFYYLRDGQFAATHPFVRKKYPDKQHQFGFSVGGPIKPDKLYYFAGFDQHIFHVPTVVQFLGGTTAVVAKPADYEATDQTLVAAAATQLSTLGGQFRSTLNGNAAFAKLDAYLTPRHKLTTRLSVSTYSGANNVFFDGTSPITNFAISGNGEENVRTATVTASLNSTYGARWVTATRLQFAHDDQSSHANSDDVGTRIHDIISGFGRSSILPRSAIEDRVQLAETANYQGARHALKFGGDIHLTSTRNYFPGQAGGFYIFDSIKVNPFTFKPQLAGLTLTPLRAYAHQVPRYYSQDFGAAVSHPDTNEFALFWQDTVRVNERLAITAGLRYDLQTFRQPPLLTSPVIPQAGLMPEDKNNFAPRLGIAASLGDHSDPFVLRGGFGVFYPRIPQIYNSTVELENGTQQHLFLDNSLASQRLVFPSYPHPLQSCLSGTPRCVAPSTVSSFLTTDVSVFAKDFQNPYVMQGSFSLEKRVAPRTDVTLSYLFVGGRHLIRGRDTNLPKPKIISYPVLTADGKFTGDFLDVTSFGTIQNTVSPSCPIAPCVNDAVRPNPKLGAVTVFESAASSTYHGFTLSVQKRFAQSFSTRLGYTYAKALDDTQDALVAGRPTVVENSLDTKAERALSVVDQRQRFVSSFLTEPSLFGRDHAVLAKIFNDWKFSGIFSAGSGRPLSGHIDGDANRDANTTNDRLPGARRNSFIGPDYFSGEARITRRFHLTEQWRLEATAEAFNVFNHRNDRVDSSDDGFTSTAASFITLTTTIAGKKYPARFQQSTGFLAPTNAYAPRQVQFSLRLKW